MKTNCILYIASPHQVISALTAVLSIHNPDIINVTLLIHCPVDEQEISGEVKIVVENMTSNFSFIDKVATFSKRKMSRVLSSKDFTTAKTVMIDHLQGKHYQEIYYAHDLMGDVYQFLCMIYPGAKRICFGDAFGFLIERDKYFSHTSHSDHLFKRIHHHTNRLLKRFEVFIEDNINYTTLPNLYHRRIRPHVVALILPIDISGGYFDDVERVICSREIFLAVVEKCIKSTTKLQKYIELLLSSYNHHNKLLILTEYHSEWGCIDFNKEVEMYIALIRRFCPNRGVVLVKSHPTETLPKNEEIVKRLKSHIKVVALDSSLKRYPIELWKNIVLNCKIVSMSYPVLSLKYLYDVNVIQPMDDKFIENWFPKWAWNSYKYALQSYTKPLSKLNNWDGKSMLWSSNASNTF